MSAADIAAKHVKVKQLSAAIVRQKENLAAEKSADALLELQHLQNQRRELMGLMPKLRVVGGTAHAG